MAPNCLFVLDCIQFTLTQLTFVSSNPIPHIIARAGMAMPHQLLNPPHAPLLH